MRQMFADQMAARRIFSDALETQDHVFDSATSATRLVHLSQKFDQTSGLPLTRI